MALNDFKILMLKGEKGEKGDRGESGTNVYDDTEIRGLISAETSARQAQDGIFDTAISNLQSGMSDVSTIAFGSGTISSSISANVIGSGCYLCKQGKMVRAYFFIRMNSGHTLPSNYDALFTLPTGFIPKANRNGVAVYFADDTMQTPSVANVRASTSGSIGQNFISTARQIMGMVEYQID